jgi:hypothetical protein
MKKRICEFGETEEVQSSENGNSQRDSVPGQGSSPQLVATIAAGLLGTGFHEASAVPTNAAKRMRTIQLAVKRAREIVVEASKPVDTEVRAYQLFEPHQAMSDTQVANVFKQAGWGSATMNSADTVKQCVRAILAEARKEAGYAEQRKALLAQGMDSEYGRIVMKRSLVNAFRDANFNSIFGEAAEGEIERTLDHLHLRASELLSEFSADAGRVPLVDGGFSARVFLSPKSDLDMGSQCEMGIRKMVAVAAALLDAGLGAEAGERSVKRIDALILWFGAFSDLPPKLIEVLEECRGLAESGDDVVSLKQRCGSLCDTLYQLAGDRLATEFLRTLDWNFIYRTCGLDGETTEVDEWPSMVREPGDDENHYSAALRFIQGLKGLFRWRHSREAPSFSGTMSPIPTEKHYERDQTAKAYERSLAITAGFLDEMEFCARRSVAYDIADNLGDEFARLYDSIRREIISLEFFGAQIDQGNLKDWGETQVREVMGPSSSKFIPYPIFLYADLRRLQRNRLVPRDFTKVDRSMIVSDLHEEGEPIPYGVGDVFPDTGR